MEYVPWRMADDPGMPPPRTRAQRVLARVRATPPGFVRTYGDVSPGAPRFAGTVLAGVDDPTVPWHRIVRADGSIATSPAARQQALLEAEGVPFRGARVDMREARLPEGVEVDGSG
jgi:methylated-DNA-protein-cysteine methyltransferase related protein